MSQLTPSVLQVNGQLIETYARISKVDSQTRTELGLPVDGNLKSNIGLASIEEYIVLQSAIALNTNESAIWDLSQLDNAVKVESIFIDSPQADRFKFEILGERNAIIFSLTLSRNKTPYDLPDAPLSNDLKIKFTARDAINLVRIVCKPVIISQTLLSDSPQPLVQ